MTGPPKHLEVRNVSVHRSGTRVLDGASVDLEAGQIVAIIGPNGAGKTTLLEAAIGAVPLAGGEVLVDGRPLRTLSQRAPVMGYLAAEAEPPHEARVQALLEEMEGGSDPAWRRELEGRLGLGQLRSAPAGTLSRGERRRVLLYEVLASSKPFLLLDEPTGVFDPLQLVDVVTLFRAATARGAGLLVTVHQMSDAGALDARLVILNRGRVLAAGALDELRRSAGLGAASTLQAVFLALLRRGPSEREADSPA